MDREIVDGKICNRWEQGAAARPAASAGFKSPARRELIIPFGATGYVGLYEIASPSMTGHCGAAQNVLK